jgi:hypothetical protein
MKPSTARTTLFLIAASACGHPTTSATPSTPNETAPAELKISRLDDYRSDPRFYADRIYVYGRSENHIAFVNEPADEACGCYQPSIVLQDLRFGKVVWADSYDSEKAPAAKQWKNLDQLWRAHGADWEQRLREAGINREPSLALATLPTGGTSMPRFELHFEKVDDRVTSYRIDLATKETTTEIANASAEKDLRSVEVLGVVPPIGDGAAAVLIAETRNGFENAAMHRIRVVGAEVRFEPN